MKLKLKSTLKGTLKKAVVALYKLQCKVLPMRKNIVLFMSNMGKNYSGNPRAIYEALEKMDKNNKRICVWAFTKLYLSSGVEKELPKECKIVQYGSFKYYYYLAVAGYWIFDTRQEPYLVKRKKCTYIQTWHGTPLKKLGIDIKEMNMSGEFGNSSLKKHETQKEKGKKITDNTRLELLKKYHDSFRDEAAKWNYLVAQNEFSSHTFRRCFDYKGKMLPTGYPRNDKLISFYENYIKNKSTESVLESQDKKVLLYAPTWRDDQYLEGGWYKYDSPLDYELLEKKIGDKCRIIVKLHYLVKLKKGDIPEKCIDSGFVTVCGNDRDIAELYMEADGLITDYSSVMFDYSLLKRPMFFFAYDLKRYRDKLRGFYFDFCKEAPGHISETTEQLLKDIKNSGFWNLKNKAYTEVENINGDISEGNVGNKVISQKYKDFCQKYNQYDDGHASERIAQLILR